MAIPGSAQVFRRQAVVSGQGYANGGSCTVEVMVDGAAEIDLSGASGTLRNVSGSAPQWQRFECTSRMPANASDIRFEKLAGRGHEDLVRDPRNGGAAVVRIDDPQDGPDRYAFRISWNSGQPNGYNQPYPNGNARYGNGQYGDRAQAYNGQASRGQEIEACRAQVRQRAAQQFGTGDIEFQNSRLDDDNGPTDRVFGTFYLRRDRDRDQPHSFTCSMDRDGDRVMAVNIDSGTRYQSGSADRTMDMSAAAAQSCRSQVDNRMRRDGFGDIRFENMNTDSRNGSVSGSVRGDRGQGSQWFRFSCRVDNNGNVRGVDLTQR